eukprot:282960-Rhodomonas_salina.1
MKARPALVRRGHCAAIANLVPPKSRIQLEIACWARGAAGRECHWGSESGPESVSDTIRSYPFV